MARFRIVVPAACALLVAGSALGAQGGAPACNVDISKGALARVAFVLEQARTGQGTAVAASLSNAVKQLEGVSDDAGSGRSMLLGQTLVMWLSQPTISLTPTRGALGFTKSPEAQMDLVGAIDSLFRTVETAKPNCVETTQTYRGNSAGYIRLANSAIGALNAEKIDSAEYFAKLAGRLFPASPYPGMVLGGVASRRGDNAAAVQHYLAAETLATKDTVYRDVQRQMLFNAGAIQLNAANAASGGDRIASARQAASTYQRLIAVPGTRGPYLTSGRQNYQSALLLASDTASLAASYAPILANPEAYEFQDVLNSAVSAARASRAADAARMFEFALTRNPYNRDALFNLGLTYLAVGQNEKVAPIVTRLVALDPANPENYNLAARAYLAMANAAKTAKKLPQTAALNDTTMVWFSRGDKLPVAVTFTSLTGGEKQYVIGGQVADRRDKITTDEASAAPAPKGAKKPAPKPAPSYPPTAVTLKFEVLDAKGAVLGTQNVTTEPLTPGATANFTVTIPAPNAAGFRYSIGG